MIVLPAALAGWYLMARGSRTNPNAVVVSQDITAAERAAEGGAANADGAPSFDIARIDIGGQAVISGHAAPGAKVTLLAGGARNGDATANDRGEWVAVLNQALAGGTQDIGAVSASQDQAERHSEQHVIAVMQHGDKPPLVLLERPGLASRILQRPDEDISPLGVDVVDYSPDGKVFVSGHAAPKASVRLYLDNAPSGLVLTDARGGWSFAPAGLATGAYNLRIDQLDSKGGVAARVELPFERLDGAAAANTLLGKANLASRLVSSKWHIARRLAGTSFQYAVVYPANQARVRDPNLVYPGQIFEPGEASVE